MDLPNDSIGVSDLKDWQACPRRMSFSMKRWGPDGEPPEAKINPNVRYGTAVHDAIEYIEETGASNEEAIQHLLSNGHRWIDPEVAEEIKADLDVHRDRDDPLNWKLVMNETDIRVPLMVYGGKQIFFRAKIDRLYQHVNDPGYFWLRDAKSSRWMRTQEEVDDDTQMSAYDWGLREWMPEIDRLKISYDQLRFGEIETSRTDDDRQKISEWLRMATISVLNDDEYGPDGLLVPEFNQWCAYCPIMESCAVVPLLTDYALAEIARLAPEVKEGRTVRVDLDPDVFDVYVDQLEKVATARGVLERFEKTIKARLQEMPLAEREAYGYKLTTRNFDVFSPEALRAAHRLLGDDFYAIVSLSKQALTRAVGEDESKLKLLIGMADRRPGAQFVRRSGPGRR